MSTFQKLVLVFLAGGVLSKLKSHRDVNRLENALTVQQGEIERLRRELQEQRGELAGCGPY